MTRPLRVLHLEDSPRDAELVLHRLEVEGVPCDIHRAHGQASFESALAQQSFDLIISDYNLPGYDGITALRQAQATQHAEEAPIFTGVCATSPHANGQTTPAPA
jgi:CheY-like chemotaxis protein